MVAGSWLLEVGGRGAVANSYNKTTVKFETSIDFSFHGNNSGHKRPSFQPVLAFEMLSSLNGILSSSQFKVRDT